MHPEAMQWLSQYAQTDEAVTVLDIGGRFINGTAKDCFPNAAEFTVLDIIDGDNVDIVANAATWTPDKEYDVVVCAEVFEHTDEWREICATAFQACKPGGKFVVTCAGPGRVPHSMYDGSGNMQHNETYGNIEPDDLKEVLTDGGWQNVTVDYLDTSKDTRSVAWRPVDGATSC